MAYTPKTWACEDTITADDLNHIEQGIAEASGGTAPFLIFKAVSEEQTTEPCPNDASKNIYITTTTYNHTWQEIYDALNADTPVFYVNNLESVHWALVADAYYDDENRYGIETGGETLATFESPTTKVAVIRDEGTCGGK